METKITKDTLISLGLLVSIVGAVFWLTSIYAEGKQNTAEILDLKDNQKDYVKTLQSIDARLIRIEEAVKKK